MATHDYIISNASGAAVRADLNNALAAIASNNSAATEPSTTYAYQWWADTGSSPTVMKLRNAANSAWITLFQLDGEWSLIPFENGTAAAPSIYFKDSGTDTGIYSPGADQVGISAGGTSRFEISTSATTSTLPVVHPLGAVATPSITFTGDLNTGIWSPAADTIAFSEGGTEAMRIDSSGRLGIGTTSPSTTLHVLHPNSLDVGLTLEASGATGGKLVRMRAATGGDLIFQTNTGSLEAARLTASGQLLVGTSSTSSNTSILAQGNSGGPGAVLRLATTSATPANGDDLGYVIFSDSSHANAAWINATRDGGTWSASSKPTRLVFSTTADGASSPTERMRIDNAGNLFSPQTYASTTVNAANINIQPDGRFYRSTSSIKYKTDVETLGDEYADAILNCRPVWYRSTTGNDAPDWGWWGFIAEEVAEIDPRLVSWKTQEISYDDKGSAVTNSCEPEPEGVQYDRFVPHLLNLIKRQKEQIEAMEARLSALEGA